MTTGGNITIASIMTRRIVTLCAYLLLHKARQFRLAGEAYIRRTRALREQDLF